MRGFGPFDALRHFGIRRLTGAARPILAVALVACANTGGGSPPPRDRIYFPTGLATSPGGHVLYTLNSDYDLGYNGGTLQAFDLDALRFDTLANLATPGADGIPFLRSGDAALAKTNCPSVAPGDKPDGSGVRQGFGETCAPPVDPNAYLKNAVVLGAFGTELQLSNASYTDSTGSAFRRLYVPTRGDASLTWFDVRDDGNAAADFGIACGQGSSDRCDDAHHAGTNADDNSRRLVLPAEPFGLAQSAAGDALVVTHQNENKASLFSTGVAASGGKAPTLEFVVEEMPNGGISAAAVPLDADAFLSSEIPRPAFYTTSRSSGRLTLLRYVADTGSSTVRPFLTKETEVVVSGNASGVDTRGIVFDPSPRIRCKAKVAANDPDRANKLQACARKPARAFVASRSPASLLVGTVGENTGTGGGYDGTRLDFQGSIPLSGGPSRVYLAPVVERDGAYALKLFVLCYDAGLLYVIDPETTAVENVIRTAPGPFALAFDPFDFDAAARNEKAPLGTVTKGGATLPVHRFRFAYLASFLRSYVQVLDLDATAAGGSFETVVFSLGEPTAPKGS